MSIDLKNPADIMGADVVGNDETKLGSVDTVFLDNQTSAPQWAAVKTGMFGNHVSLVPLAQGTFDGSTLRVPYDKAQLKAAPHHDPDQELSPQDEDELYDHYQVNKQQQTPPAPAGGMPQQGQRDLAGQPGIEGQDTSGPTTDDAMTRSEERLNVGTEKVQAGKARLRKYVVTENVTQTVPVSHEEVRVEREPITDANRDQAMAGGDLTDEQHEVTLTEERPVVDKETVPVERVRLGTETVTGEQEVNDQVRKEQIDTETTDPRQQQQ